MGEIRIIGRITRIKHQFVRPINWGVREPFIFQTPHRERIFLNDMAQRPKAINAFAVRFPKDEVKLVPEATVLKGLKTDYFYCRDSDEVYVVDKKLFRRHLTQIFNYAIYESSLKMDVISSPETKAVFLEAIGYAFKAHPDQGHLDHYSFMINEAVRENADYLTAAAIMLHNVPDKSLNGFIQTFSGKAKDAAKEVLDIRRKFLRLKGTRYLPPHGKLNFLIQNFMDALVCICEGDGRALLIRLLHRLSSLTIENAVSPAQIKSTKEIYAPLAERFGLYSIALKLLENTFRLEDPEVYKRAEREILDATKFESRVQAEAYASNIGAKLSQILPDAEIDSRIKIAASAEAKLAYRPDDYKSILYLLDLIGVRAITKNRVAGLSDALSLAQSAMGDNFGSFNFAGKQTETRTFKVGPHTVKYHYVSVIAKDGKAIEFQFISDEDFNILTFGAKAHWAYKLQNTTGQNFDVAELEEYGKRMTGSFYNDVKVIYEYLKNRWTYVFAVSSRSRDCQRVIRRKHGSIALDAAAFILDLFMRKELFALAKIKIRKIWEEKRPAQIAAPSRTLETGDFVEVDVKDHPAAKTLDFSALLSQAKHLSTKLAIWLSTSKENWEDKTRAGKSLLESELSKKSVSYNIEVITRIAAKEELTIDGLLILIGSGYVPVKDIAAEIVAIS